MLNRVITYFIGGVALVAPIALTVWVLQFIYNFITSYYDFEHAMIGIFLLLMSLVVIGYLGSSYLGVRIVSVLDLFFQKTPIFGSFYKTAKNVTGAFVGAENKFSEPVLVQFAGDVYKVGFITDKDNSVLKNESMHKADEALYSVYLPLSFSMSGDFFLVLAHRLKPIDKSAKEVMQLVVSGGLLK